MRIKINKESIFALLVLLPYTEGNLMQSILDIRIGAEAYVKAIIFVMGALFVCFSLLNKSAGRSYIKGIWVVIIGFAIFSLPYSLALSKNIPTSICMWLWLFVPLFYAGSAARLSITYHLNLDDVFAYMIRFFAIYVLVVVCYYIAFKGLFFDSSVRMSPRGGGAVIFGYTIAVVFAVTLQVKRRFNIYEYYLLLVILTIGALATKTRASIWPIIICWIANFVFIKTSKRRWMAVILLVMLVVVVVGLADFSVIFSSNSYTGWQRLFNLHSMRRTETITSFLSLEKDVPFLKKAFGYGLGNFFPYIKWVMNIDNVENNMFLVEGHSFLVQPHNSFVYFIIETGITGFVCVICLFVYLIKNALIRCGQTMIFSLLFFVVILVVNCVDSIFFVQPGPAGLVWLLMFLVVNKHFQDFHKQGKEINVRKTTGVVS